MKGVDLKVEPTCTVVGQGFLPHYLLTCPANLVATKKLVAGQTLESVCPDAERRTQYREGMKRLLSGLRKGEAVTPPTLIDTSRSNDTALMYGPNAKDPSPAQKSYNAALLMRGDTEPSGYQLRVPLIDGLEFPKELLEILHEFAAKYPDDYLPMRLRLLACMLWADIVKEEDLSLEPFMKASKSPTPVPLVSLAACIIYLAHMLKWVEWMGLSEYPHLFRFVAKATETDLRYATLSVDSESINEDRVFELLSSVRSTVPGVSASLRVTILPYMMPGSRMPPMYGPGAPAHVETIPMALTGLTHLFYYGLEDYSTPVSEVDEEEPVLLGSRFKLGCKHADIVLPTWAWEDIQLSGGIPCQGATFNYTDFMPYWEPNPTHMVDPLSNQKKEPSSSDYEKYAVMIELWSEISPENDYPKTHLSWKEGLREAKSLGEGHRSIPALRKLVARAMHDEEADWNYVRFKIQSASQWNPILEDDVARALPLALGRLIGIEPPNEADPDAPKTPMLWTGYFKPMGHTMRDIGLAVEYGTSLLEILKNARMDGPAAIQTAKEEAMICFNRFAACVVDAPRLEWLTRWKTLCPEICYDEVPDKQTCQPAPDERAYTPEEQPPVQTKQLTAQESEQTPARDEQAPALNEGVSREQIPWIEALTRQTSSSMPPEIRKALDLLKRQQDDDL